jgi:type 1 fimbria pilin
VGKTGFQISLANCKGTASNGIGGQAGYVAHLTWSFSPYAGQTNVIANSIPPASGGSNVGVQILKSDATTGITNTADDVYTLVDGTNTFQYYAAYKLPTGTATAGNVGAQATLTVTYQ